ncbi:hypothetical protein CC86DRAFT_414157 [Ophiobolus disseminans]|uniref:C2H2-type domain-containing protein n=1 Tax=Ophiobolus disseminans TaxID=1469910 RepID=A0A6A6ZCY6_9PLEO|nr:hypothetical protein CC86DRAFT_414157 [Ophiobolus disseminans]
MASPGKISYDTYTPPERNNPVERGGNELSTKQTNFLRIWCRDFASGSSVPDESVTALAQVLQTKPELVHEHINQIYKSHPTKEQVRAYLFAETNNHLQPETRELVKNFVTACRRRYSPTDKRRSVNKGRYCCTFKCGYRTERAFDWRRHEETHEPQDIWLCTLCTPKPFLVGRKDKFLKHVNDKHSNVVAKEIQDSSKVDYVPTADLNCPYCGTESGTWDERCKHVVGHFEDVKRGAKRVRIVREDDEDEDELS